MSEKLRLCTVGWTPTVMFMSQRRLTPPVECWARHRFGPMSPVISNWATGWGHTAAWPGSG